MFFIIFILFFSKFFQINSIQCITKLDTLLNTAKCQFQINSGGNFPSDTDLTNFASQCEKRSIESVLPIGDAYCYGEVAIDYVKKTINVKLSHASGQKLLVDPYNDMVGVFTDIRSVVQYKINTNLDQNTIEMKIRILCKSADNCAVEKLRHAFSNITRWTGSRDNVYQEIKKELNHSQTTASPILKCIHEENDVADEKQCEEEENRCKFYYDKGDQGQTCVKEDSNDKYDLEYRFNVVQDTTDPDPDIAKNAVKFIYLCNKDLCNSEDNSKKIRSLLMQFVAASGTQPDIKKIQPLPRTNPNKRRSDGVYLHTSFYYRSMILIFFLIQLLLNY